jgi:hypothetical protein
MIKFILLALSLVASLHAEEKHAKLAGKLIYKYCKEITKANKALRVTGTGGRMMGDIQQIAISCFLYKHLTVSDARRLYVDMGEQFLALINNDEAIRPYMHEYPFTAKNFELLISVMDPITKTFSAQGVALILLVEKKEIICYEAYDHKLDKFITLHEETYAEARAIVQNGANMRIGS